MNFLNKLSNKEYSTKDIYVPKIGEMVLVKLGELESGKDEKQFRSKQEIIGLVIAKSSKLISREARAEKAEKAHTLETVHNKPASSKLTIVTIRSTILDCGVEYRVPLYYGDKIQVTKLPKKRSRQKAKDVSKRRAKLYYLRNRTLRITEVKRSS